MTYQGFFSLLTTQDLLNKARADFLEMESNSSDSYIAFNFFVTARHIPEWQFYNDSKKLKEIFKNHVESRICRHLADGAKHFVATNIHHTQVLSTKRQGRFDPSLFDPVIFDTNKLMVELSNEDSFVLGVNQFISAIDLARKVLNRLAM